MSELFIMADAKQFIKGDTRRNPRAFRNPILSQKKRPHFFPVACSLFIPSRVGDEELRDTLLAPTGFSGQPKHAARGSRIAGHGSVSQRDWHVLTCVR
ncbi:hypothetical protein E6H12_00420 [Candidatus Bathyarchaeota archaeon]|nr:MAG: hypothetical protein E6H12_00420 [Candidatus Bathyarchaeota archaeon]